MNTRTKAALAAAALAPAAGVLGVSDYFLRTATARTQPRSLRLIVKLMQGLKQGEDPYAGLEPDQERLRTSPHETVRITAHDGASLVGHWFERPGAVRTILAVHGWRSLWYRDFGASQDFYRDEHCNVLYIEQRGQGESDGDYIGFGMLERLDLPDWAAWINARCGEALPIYLAGISMGATTVLMAAELCFPPNVLGLMADCGFTSADAIWRHVAEDNLHLPYAPLRTPSSLLCRRRLGCDPREISTTAALKNSRLPVLFVHGEADSFVPASMTEENYAACVARKQMLLVPGAGHGLSYLVDQEGYENAIRGFWADCECGRDSET